MKNCKFCGHNVLVKHSKIKGKQRYLCKNCNKHQINQDNRKKYDEKIINTAFLLLSEGNNYRRIARILSKIFDKKISYQLVIYWVKNKVAQLPQETSKNETSRQIEIVEMDVLYTFFKKEKNDAEYGLLLTEKTFVCLHFGSALATKSLPDDCGKKFHITT